MSVREKDDDYQHVIAVLEPKLRLIEDSTDMQWIIQELMGKQWRNYWHCRTKEGLRVKYGYPAIEALPGRYIPRSERSNPSAAPQEPPAP